MHERWILSTLPRVCSAPSAMQPTARQRSMKKHSDLTSFATACLQCACVAQGLRVNLLQLARLSMRSDEHSPSCLATAFRCCGFLHAGGLLRSFGSSGGCSESNAAHNPMWRNHEGSIAECHLISLCRTHARGTASRVSRLASLRGEGRRRMTTQDRRGNGLQTAACQAHDVHRWVIEHACKFCSHLHQDNARIATRHPIGTLQQPLTGSVDKVCRREPLTGLSTASMDRAHQRARYCVELVTKRSGLPCVWLGVRQKVRGQVVSLIETI